jgi:hypothetical protein
MANDAAMMSAAIPARKAKINAPFVGPIPATSTGIPKSK